MKKELRKKIRTLEQRIREHGTKILRERAKAQRDHGRVRHRETEIKAFRDGINRARRPEDIPADYPDLEPEDIRACVAYAHAVHCQRFA